MGAGFQGHIGSRAFGGIPRLAQGLSFCMGAATRLRPAVAQHNTVTGDDTAHRGVRRDIAKAARSQQQRMAHMIEIAVCRLTTRRSGLPGQ